MQIKASNIVSSVCFGILVCLISSCSLINQSLSRKHLISDYTSRTLISDGLPHVVYEAINLPDNKILHVYIEGDGYPWINGVYESTDPSAGSPFIFNLMTLDAANKIYLGRPCYNGLASIDNCDKSLWTSHRYSESVIEAMRLSLNRLYGGYDIVLIGHSGGGVLAMLIAENMANVSAVVTIASNLDTETWLDHHGYKQLDGSLNPARSTGLPSNIRQYHLAGGDDDNVPASLIERFVKTQKNAVYLYHEEYGHECCWSEIWSEIINLLNGSSISEASSLKMHIYP